MSITLNALQYSRQIITYSIVKKLGSGPKKNFGGGDRHRTRNLWLAKPSLYQLSYTPSWILVIYHHKRTPKMVGLSGVEPLTSRLSGVRSHQLSYRPMDL